MPSDIQAIASAADTIARLSAAGLLALGFILFALGRIRSGAVVDKDVERADREKAGWQTVATAAVAKLGELTAAVNRLTDTIRDLRAEIVRLRDLVRQLGGKP